jgi:hypothetical protein
MNEICRSCGSTESQIVDDARTLGLLKELQSGIYTCCQIVVWADEQWLAWVEAAEEDGKAVDDVTRPLESADGETVVVPVRSPPDSRLGETRSLQSRTQPAEPSSSIGRARPHGIERAKSIVVAVRSFIRFLGATG